MNYKQFEIYNVNLSPTEGSEQKGKRPCIVFQTNVVSDLGRTTLIVPLTSKKVEHIYPYEVLVHPSKENNLKELSKAKLDQIRVIDKRRIQKKIGILERKYQDLIFEALEIIIDRRGDFRE